ncbi:23S rRNA (pseudouridine(1915)-N(3))-methyltransferase RlmH [Flaviaesturariibacter amylovorans]|uniref:Ribosomal RNA large subunit methyltransferase H n=1 Tax=Flaviaesturariibacter amylovorans TaxID=1084520 RepID=A0ABP8GXS0_9BACT
MKLSLWTIGKNHEPYVKAGIDDFTKRLSRYFPAEWQILPVPRNAATMAEPELRRREGELVLDWLKPDDFLVALDERGKMLSSEGLAAFLQQRATESTRHIVFLIGGAFGLDPAVLKRAQLQWSLSALTFPHQLVRLLLAEQLYRACTILRNEKYHHK